MKEALLVIHGIGQQNPYETLDQFAGGLIDQFARGNSLHVQPIPLMIAHKGWNEVAIRLELNGQPTKYGAATLDIYEFYWAPYTEGKITYWQVLAWLRRTVLTPLRYLATAYHLLEEETRPGMLGSVQLFCREILRAVFLYLPALVLLLLIGYLLAVPDDIWGSLSGLQGAWRETGLWHRILFVTFVGLLTIIWFLGGALRHLSHEKHVFRILSVRSVPQKVAEQWDKYVKISLAAATIMASLLAWWLLTDLFRYVKAGRPIFPPAIFAVMGQWLKGLLVDYVGDIAVYVNADAKAASYEARTKILADAQEAVLRLSRSPEQYDRIVLAGHSLGSVIAYDLLNELLSEVRASYKSGPKGSMRGKLCIPNLTRIQGLVTFGSPLDKIAYFFRTEVPPGQAIRSQIISFLHAFRRKPSGRSYGPYEFPRYTVPDPSPDFTWINVWAKADPVSGHLDFYSVGPAPAQFERDYPLSRWGRAHLDYWSDPRFYEIVADRVL